MKANRPIKVLLIIFAIVLLILTMGGATVYVYKQANTSEKVTLNLTYGDNFPFSVINYFNDDIRKTFQAAEYKLIIYSAPYCSSCMKEISYIKQTMAILNGNGLESLLLLNEEPKVKNISEIFQGIEELSYVNDDVKVNNSFPYYFLVKDENVIFSTNDMGLMIEKIFDSNIVNIDKCVESANEYLTAKYSDSDSDLLIVALLKTNISDKEILTQYSTEATDSNYKIIPIYDKTSQSTNSIIDMYNLFARIYQVNEYPHIFQIGNVG